MRSPGLVVMVVAGAVIVGYAFYVVSTRETPHPRKAREPAADGEDGEHGDAPRARRRPPRRRPPASSRPARAKREPADPVGAERVESATPKPGPPPRPEPEISLAEAREQFADFMAELERLETDGTELTSPQWVEYYKRGHDALLPLQQHLDWQVPDEAEELRRANEDMRAKLGVLDPGRRGHQNPPSEH